MSDLPTLESVLYGGQDAGGYRFLARSAGFREEWLAEAERLCTGFGERPAGVACPRAVFAHPLDAGHRVVVQVADQGADDQGRPGALAFYLVVFPEPLYAWLGGDPFHLAEQMPPPWSSRGFLGPRPCPPPAPPRRVEDVQKILNVPHSATLLGAAQVLLDGGRLVLERSAPDEALLRGLWALLPTAARAEFWPASFAFGNALEFHVVAVPRLLPEQFEDYLHEEQAGDYPEGKYELDLQVATERGDQETLDALFARRSYREIRRIGLLLLAIVLVLPLLAALLKRDAPEVKPRPRPPSNVKPEEHGLPGPGQFEELTEEQTRDVTRKLLTLMETLGVPWPPQPREAMLLFGGMSPAPGTGPLRAAAVVALERRDRSTPEELLPVLNRFLGTPNPRRDPGSLERHGPAKRQLRLLLWKHGSPRYHDRTLGPSELVEHLHEAVTRERKEAP